MIPITITYTPYAEGVKIIGVTGRAAEIRIPDQIGGLPVIAIAPYAFAVQTEAEARETETPAQLSFAEGEDIPRKAPLKEVTGEALKRLYLPDTIREIGAYAFGGCAALEVIHLPEHLAVLPDHMFAGCISLKQIALPPHLSVIEGYAFYDCRSLEKLRIPETVQKMGAYACYNCRKMEQINIPRETIDLGMGLFLNCDKLTSISFGRCRHIADLVAVLNHELHLTIDFDDGNRAKLLIPDFQYEYIEDTPARQFHQVNYGTGHLFRQCIGNSDIDFRRFDELFYLTKREDGALMVLLLTMYRLEYPYRLQEDRKQDYLQYLKDHFANAFGYYLNRGDLEKIRLFAQWGLITAENIDSLLEMAGEAKKTEITGFLLEYQHAHFAKKKKSFDL